MATEKDLRGDRYWQIIVPYTVATSVGGTSFIAPFNATIKSAKWTPSAAITANGTNFFTLSFFNRGAAGAGTVQWATARSYAAVNGVKATPETLTLSSTAADLNVTAGDVLNVELGNGASGLINPGGVVTIVVWNR